MGGLGKFYSPPAVNRISGHPGHLVEGMHPFGQIVVILPVSVPFQILVKRLVRSAFIQRLADTQAPAGGMLFSFFSTQTADPAGPGVILPVPAVAVVRGRGPLLPACRKSGPRVRRSRRRRGMPAISGVCRQAAEAMIRPSTGRPSTRSPSLVDFSSETTFSSRSSCPSW